MIAIGDGDITKAYVGSTEATKMYLGDTLVFGTETIPDYFCLTSTGASTVTRTGTYSSSLEYSKDGTTWATFSSSVTVSLANGEFAYFRGNNSRLGSSSSKYTQFVMTGSIAASGDIRSLLSKSGFSSITTIPASYCFYRLFYGCNVMTSAPVLPFLTCITGCYARLFQNCSLINHIVMLATDVSASGCLNNWVNGVASSGTFVKHIDATWTTTGNAGVPSNWTIIYYDPNDSKYYTDQTKATECDEYGNII